MRPTPRKLVLLMSIAGLGASLGEAAQAKGDDDAGARSRLAAVLGLPDAARQERFKTRFVQEDGSPLVVSVPLDGTLSAAGEAAAAPAEEEARGDVLRPEAEKAVATASSSAAPLSSSQAERDVEAPATVLTADPAPPATGMPAAVSPLSAPPLPDDPAGHWVVNGIRVRDPKGPPPSAKPWESVSASGNDPPTGASTPESDIRPAADATSEPTRDDGLAASAADDNHKRVVTLPDKLRAYLAVHQQTFGVPAEPAPEGPQAAVDIDLSALDQFDLGPGVMQRVVDPGLNFDLGANPGTGTQPQQAGRLSVGSHADRVMSSLEALLSPPGRCTADDIVGTPANPVFVASHAQRALLTLASTLQRTDDRSTRGLAAGARLGEPPVAAAVSAQAATARPSSWHVTAAAPSAVEETTATADEHHHQEKGASVRTTMGEALALNEATLDQVRGGFQTDTGLQMTFGIERAVYINGSLVTTTNVNVAETANGVAVQVPVAAVTTGAGAGSGNLTVIQNGAGNSFMTGPISPATVGTVVQNTLNNQNIQNMTTINATVNSLQLMKAQSFESSLRGAIVDSLRR